MHYDNFHHKQYVLIPDNAVDVVRTVAALFDLWELINFARASF